MPKRISGLLTMSDAASLALHTTVLLAAEPHRSLQAREIAATFRFSKPHVAKVLQQLRRAGIISSARGPRGGFWLAEGANEITLLQVFEAMEGPLRARDCLLGRRPLCGGETCILAGLVGNLNRQVKAYLAETTLSKLAPVYKSFNRRYRDAQERG